MVLFVSAVTLLLLWVYYGTREMTDYVGATENQNLQHQKKEEKSNISGLHKNPVITEFNLEALLVTH